MKYFPFNALNIAYCVCEIIKSILSIKDNFKENVIWITTFYWKHIDHNAKNILGQRKIGIKPWKTVLSG